MSDDRPSIAELRRRVIELASMPWSVAPDPAIAIVRNDDDEQVADFYDGTMFSDVQCQSNAAGIAALRNAAPVLLEIAAAALAYDRSQQDAAVVRYAFAQTESDGLLASISAHDKDEARCRAAYLSALAKVRP